MGEFIISFTKLDLVQIKTDSYILQEVPTTYFLETIENDIKHNVSKNQVVYDSLKETFILFHNGKKYDIYYGDKKANNKIEDINLIERLNKLVELSNEQKNINNCNNSIKETETTTLEQIIKNGNNGIFYNEDDKILYIKYYEKKLLEDSIFKNCWKGSKLKNCFDLVVIINTILLCISFMATLVSFPLHFIGGEFFFVGIMYFTFDTIVGYIFDNSITYLLLKLLYHIFGLVYFPIKNGISKLLKKRQLKGLSKSLVKSKISVNKNSKVPIKIQENSAKVINQNKKNEIENTVRRICSKINIINDSNNKKLITKELNEIMEMFQDITISDYQEKINSILSNLCYLDGKTSEMLKVQLNNQTIMRDHQKTIESISVLNKNLVRSGSLRK